ncbi:FAD-binding protein [Brevibacterium sp. BRM-1]|uniref:FAD-binding oxidoreductase n=1 Tax=Brevibacterium sp. BRM-1 TaxID=2999062 RepID=UPI00227F5192|nr:FAD-linked oxidase C-terminal domain-containing protein [Brevibacterium sp. BRM-1]WAL41639.1 FAD-binding protein [Brevibacterium sp. BRM-1]
MDLAPLREALSAGAVVEDADVIAAHSADHALFSPVGTARALVRAHSIEDVQATLRFAHEHRIPVVPQGSRTGLSGAANAVDGCLLLSLAKMDAIVGIDPAEGTCTVQPGVINQALKDALADHGLSYPPDPGSVAISSIGGNVATNAGGLCCVKYGVTADYVRRLRVVLADGSLATLGRPTAKGVAGLGLAQLFVGSEGTLGVVVEVTLDVVPALPQPLTAIAVFPDSVSAAGTVSDYMTSGGKPALMEFIDGTTIGMINDYGDFGLPADAGAMLIVQADGDGTLSAASAELEAFAAAARANGASEVMHSEDPRDSELLIAARRAVSPASEKYAVAHGGGVLVDDVCVPRERLREMFAAVARVDAQFPDLTVGTCAHAGDGNLHPSIFFDAQDPHAVAAAEEAFALIMEAGLELGGTITGEHGVGVLKAGWLARELDPAARALHLAIKRAVDPRGILNPGKMLALLGE